MGGICGFIGEPDKAVLKSMCNAIRHRGSKVDYYMDSDIAVAVRSLENEARIERNEDVITAFEGDIYGSADLSQGVTEVATRNNPSTDAQLVLEGFQRSGTESFAGLFGSFACAIWDADRKKLTLAKDHFGQSSLYYSYNDGRLFFASEIKSLLEAESIPRLLDREALAQYLEYGCVFSPRTLFSRITKLPAACTVTFCGGSVGTPERYWKLDFHPQIFDKDKSMSMIYKLLLNSVNSGVKRHRRFAIFLSGGFDSSLIAALARKCTDDHIDSYTYMSAGEENTSARLVADYLDLVHHEVTLSVKESVEILKSLPKVFENLIGDPFISIPTYALAKAARGKEVIFAADGADSIFWGMPSIYKRFTYFKMLGWIPRKIRQTLLSFSERFGEVHVYQRSLSNFLKASLSNAPYAYAGRIFTDDDIRKLIRKSPRAYASVEPKGRSNGTVTLTDFYEYQLRTAPDRPAMIARTGPMCTAFSLKLFEPFLAPQLVELATKISPSLKQPAANRDKLILRETARKYELLPSGFEPRKLGLRCLLDDWFMGELSDWVRGILEDELPSFLDKSYVSALLNRKRYLDVAYSRSSSSRTSTRDIFTLLMFVLWFKEYDPQV